MPTPRPLLVTVCALRLGAVAMLLGIACTSGVSTIEDPSTESGADVAAEVDVEAQSETSVRPRPSTVDGEVQTSDAEAETSADRSGAADTASATWTACDAPFQCATITVPLDHEIPDGATIDLSLVRIEATGDPQGSIFINLGGPGGSTNEAMRRGFRMDEQTMASYHLVGFDPRGIGESSPLTCSIDLADATRPDFSPDNDRERLELDTAASDLAEQCEQLDGDLLPHLGTESVVADLDLMRQAVGDDALHYIGLSYGTVIGLRYADRFPDLVGRMVLDGVVDPTFSLPDLLRQQSIEFERAFVVMDAACDTALACPEGGIIAAYDRLLADIENKDISDGVGPAEFQIATLLAMYSERLWPQYAAALNAAEVGDFGQVEQLHDLYVGGISFEAYIAVSCIDSRSPVGPDRWDAFADELAAQAPRFGAALANELRACAHWPVSPTSEPKPVVAGGAEPILVLSTTGDAPTPVANAITVTATLASAGMVTVENEGHTAYGKNFCVEQIVADYFATGEVPVEVHRC